MASRATVGQSGTKRQGGIHVAAAITDVGPLTLSSCELALEELTPSLYRSKRVAIDDETRRVWGHDIPPPGANLFRQRFVNALASRIRCLSPVDQLTDNGRYQKTISHKQ
jgi:hypothetical protein